MGVRKRGSGSSGPHRRTPYTPTRPKYGTGGKPTGKRAYVSARHGAGMKNKITGGRHVRPDSGMQAEAARFQLKMLKKMFGK